MTSTISRTNSRTTSKMKRTDALLLVGLIAVVAPALAADFKMPAVSARRVAEGTVDQVIAVLNESGASEASRGGPAESGATSPVAWHPGPWGRAAW